MTTQLSTSVILQAYEVRLHYKRPLFNTMAHITSAKEAHLFLRSHVNSEQLDLREHFWVILLTNANRVLGFSKVASGTSRGVQTNIKYIFQVALRSNASAIILAHNHPSGILQISECDIRETNKIKELANFLDITLLDHVILTSESYVSLAEEDKI